MSKGCRGGTGTGVHQLGRGFVDGVVVVRVSHGSYAGGQPLRRFYLIFVDVLLAVGF